MWIWGNNVSILETGGEEERESRRFGGGCGESGWGAKCVCVSWHHGPHSLKELGQQSEEEIAHEGEETQLSRGKCARRGQALVSLK